MTVPVLFGLSQFGLLHFGQTLGFSSWRGNHSWPQRHRQPSNITIPIWCSSEAFIRPSRSTLTKSIYGFSSCLTTCLPLVYIVGRLDRRCATANGSGWRSPRSLRSSAKVVSGSSRHNRGEATTQYALIQLSRIAPAEITPRPVGLANTSSRSGL
jgi:hypothetical protein